MSIVSVDGISLAVFAIWVNEMDFYHEIVGYTSQAHDQLRDNARSNR